MAATQPIIVTTSTTIRLDQVFVAQKDDYIVIAAEVQVEAQWDLATDTGFTAIIWTTGLRVPDQHQLGT
ncbi:MAG: hypothetical protein Q8P61_07985, partial [Candidatus Nanopelagicales bacterium]|nr:hypothetical protein [Candidatus Nanopelagicales bacterium]